MAGKTKSRAGPAAGNPARPRRNAALAVRRDRGSAVHDPELRLRQRRAGRAALQGRRAGLHLFALRQPDRRHVRGAHAPDGGRRSGAGDRQRHGRGHLGVPLLAQGRRPCGGGQGAVRLVPLRRRGPAAALRHHVDAGRRQRPQGVEAGGAQEHQGLLPGEPDQPDARRDRHRRRRRDRPQGGGEAGGRQCLRHAALPEAARARRRRGGLFGDQAHRRPGPLPRRGDPRRPAVHHRPPAHLPAPDRPVDEPVQCLGAAQGAGDAAGARRAADGEARRSSPTGSPATSGLPACSIPAAPTIRRPRSPSGR